MADKPRLKLPKEAKKGEIIEIKTLMPHIMESGQRKDKDGNTIPRTEFNELVKDGSIRHWRECFASGHVKASGAPEILRLIQSVVEKQDERTRTRKLRAR